MGQVGFLVHRSEGSVRGGGEGAGGVNMRYPLVRNCLVSDCFPRVLWTIKRMSHGRQKKVPPKEKRGVFGRRTKMWRFVPSVGAFLYIKESQTKKRQGSYFGFERLLYSGKVL